jgi:SAM-dependent methyltransferase
MQQQGPAHHPPRYALGHADDELDCLIDQGRLFGSLTEHALHLAGLARRMRVLDVGWGPGQVTFLAVRLVGPEVTVSGVDLSPSCQSDGVPDLMPSVDLPTAAVCGRCGTTA